MTKMGISRSNLKTIGIDVNALTRAKYTGTERYTFELIRALMDLKLGHEEIILYSSEPIQGLGNLPKGWRYEIIPWRWPGYSKIALSLHLLHKSPDVLFIPAHSIPPITGKAKVITTVHDLAFLRIPQAYPDAERARQIHSFRRAMKSADHILTISESTKRDINEFAGSVLPISVAHLGVNPASFKERNKGLAKYGVKKGRYLFYIGRIEAKKNIQRMLDAFQIIRKDYPDLQFILAGKPGFGADTLVLPEGARLLNFVPQEDIASLYAGSAAFLFTTLYEGFGMPILEAMLCGAPVVTSDLPAHREVGDVYAYYADALNNDAIADTVKKAMKTGPKKGAHDYALTFNWKRTAEATMKAIRELYA